MSNVKLIWDVPNTDGHLGYIARVSNPDNQDNPSVEGLLKYMMREGHTSPFEMVCACIEINTTRDIGRQILRHRSFSFQEFSQRYEDVSKLEAAPFRECRLQDAKNRQSSLETDEENLVWWWNNLQQNHIEDSMRRYRSALGQGIAKEQARALLPEGLTPSRMYMQGNFRSWIFYLKQRLHPSTQKEHRLIAQQILAILRKTAPITMAAFFGEE